MTAEQVKKPDQESKRTRVGEIFRGVTLVFLGGVLGIALYTNADRFNKFLKPPVGLDPEVILTSADLENESNDGLSPDVVIDLQYGDKARSRQFDSLVPFERLCALIGCESRGMGQKLKDLGYIHNDEGLYGVRDVGNGRFLILVRKFPPVDSNATSLEDRLILVEVEENRAIEVYKLGEDGGHQIDFLDSPTDSARMERLQKRGFSGDRGVLFFEWRGAPESPNDEGLVLWVPSDTLAGDGITPAVRFVESWGNPTR